MGDHQPSIASCEDDSPGRRWVWWWAGRRWARWRATTAHNCHSCVWDACVGCEAWAVHPCSRAGRCYQAGLHRCNAHQCLPGRRLIRWRAGRRWTWWWAAAAAYHQRQTSSCLSTEVLLLTACACTWLSSWHMLMSPFVDISQPHLRMHPGACKDSPGRWWVGWRAGRGWTWWWAAAAAYHQRQTSAWLVQALTCCISQHVHVHG